MPLSRSPRSLATAGLLLPMLFAPHVLAQDELNGDEPPPEPTPMATSLPVARIDDHSYLGSSLPGALRALKRGDLNRADLPPRSILGLTAALLFDGRTTITAPTVFYSNTTYGFDIRVSPFLTGYQGVSVDLGKDLTPEREDLARRLEDLYDLNESAPDRPRELRRAEVILGKYVPAFNRLATATRIGLTAGYFDLDDIGSAVRGGVVVSRLFKLDSDADESGGVLAGVQLEGVSFNPEFGESRTALRTTLRAAWQDRVQQLLNGGERVVRWQWQAGVEYSPENRIARDDTLAFFVRYRSEPDAARERLTRSAFYNKSVELGLSVGLLPGNDPFVSFSITKAFGL